MPKNKRSPSPESNNKKIRSFSEDGNLEQLKTYFEEDSQEDYKYHHLDIEIDSIEDLIKLGKMYNYKDKIKYNIDIKTLNNLIKPLEDLNNLIGMKLVKQTVIDQIIYYLQDIDDIYNDMLHSVIEGPPGVGKTELAKMLATIYKQLGILSKNKFKSVKRSDLIGSFLGQTAVKTQKY